MTNSATNHFSIGRLPLADHKRPDQRDPRLEQRRWGAMRYGDRFWKAVAFPCLMAFHALLVLAAPVVSAGEQRVDPKLVHTREVYVPYPEFMQIVGQDKNAAIMTLEEYRALVGLAAIHDTPKVEPPLPPIASALTDVVYRGTVKDLVVRFEAHFKLQLSHDSWVRCALGPIIPGLGRITLDDGPGWLVVDNGQAYLMVQGAGQHQGTFSFSAPVHREEDELRIQSPLLKASGSVVHLTVSGRSKVKDNSDLVDRIYDEERQTTTFTLPIGNGDALQFAWKGTFGAEQNQSLLIARQRVSWFLRAAHPEFRWDASVRIERRRADKLVFTEPPGARVVRLMGPQIHSWHRIGEQIQVVLDRPFMGIVEFQAEGVAPTSPDSLNLGCPALEQAFQDTCILALYGSQGHRIEVEAEDGFREVPGADEEFPKSSGHPLAGKQERPEIAGRARVFLQQTRGSMLKVKLNSVSVQFDQDEVHQLHLDSTGGRLESAIMIVPDRGRLYELVMRVPRQWTLVQLQEHQTNRTLRVRETIVNGETQFLLLLEEAADRSHPLQLRASFQLSVDVWGTDTWESKNLDIVLPAVDKARTVRSHLAIGVDPEIDAVFQTDASWQARSKVALEALKVPIQVMRAGLYTEKAGNRLGIGLTRKQPRGEYESATHLLVFEREALVRLDLRMAVVDRAVEELVLNLPLDAPLVGQPLLVSGFDIKEVGPGSKPQQRVVRFNRAWQGIRMLRVEYRVPVEAEKEMPIPEFSVQGKFDGRRGIVFQSAGSVRLEIKPGSGLSTASLDDTAAFAQPFQQGRSVSAYTYRSTLPGGAGSYQARIYEHSEVLSSVVREMNITTQLDASGLARTHVSFLLSYARDQYLGVRLPANARWLAVRIDGERVRPVRTAQADVRNIPLPPRSFAQIDLVYDQNGDAWGWLGNWQARGPELLLNDLPVGVTNWKVVHPEAYRVQVSGGNLEAEGKPAPAYFASTFWRPIFTGRWPQWITFAPESRVAPERIHLADPQTEIAQGQVAQGQAQGGNQALQSVEAAKPDDRGIAFRSLGGLAIPEGLAVKSRKLGGTPELHLFYRDTAWSRFARRTIFFAAILLGIFLMSRYSERTGLLYALFGLILGTALPVAIEWGSPLLWVPFCEGLICFLAILVLYGLGARLAALLTLRGPAGTRLFSTRSAMLLIFALLLCPDSQAQEIEPVLIPYPLDQPKGPEKEAEEKDQKVYVPRSVFIDLMTKAYPKGFGKGDDKTFHSVFGVVPEQEEEPISKTAVFGNASYEITVSDQIFRAVGHVDVRTFDKKGWGRLILDTGPAQLVAVRVNDAPASISMVGGKPFIPLKGAGLHQVHLEIQGALRVQPGQAEMHTRLIGGPAKRVILILPSTVKLDVKSLPSGAWLVDPTEDEKAKAEKGMRNWEVQVGEAQDLSLRWLSDRITGTVESRIASTSFTHLTLAAEGYKVSRIEQVSINGSPRSSWTYRVIGDWQMGEVNARELSEWSVREEEGVRKLTLVFPKPLQEVRLEFNGWGVLFPDKEAQVAGLALDGAMRQEGFVALSHGGGRRFTAASLSKLGRSSQAEVHRDMRVSVPPSDRVYRFLEPPTGHQISSEWPSGRIDIETDVVGVIRPDRFLVLARSKYNLTATYPLRHEVQLPEGWEVQSVDSPDMRDWQISERGAGRLLIVHFNTHVRNGGQVIWTAERKFEGQTEGVPRLDLPMPRVIATRTSGQTGTLQERVQWILAADQSLELTQVTEGLGPNFQSMRSVPLARSAKWAPLAAEDSYRFAFESSKPESTLALQVSRRSKIAHATVVEFVRASEDHVQVNARLRFQIRQAGISQLKTRLPKGARLVGVQTDQLRSWSVAQQGGVDILSVQLQSEISGEQIVDLSYRIERKGGEDVVLGPLGLESEGVQRVERYVGLLRFDRGLVTIAKIEGLAPIEEMEDLPFLPDGVSQETISKVYAADTKWSLHLRQPEVQVAVGEQAEVVLAVLTTVIAADGRMRSEAAYTVRNRSRQFLKVVLPDQSRLWGVLVDGRPSTVSRETMGGKAALLIPIQQMGLTDLPIEVRIIFEHERVALPAVLRNVTPRAPEVLDTPVVETYWQLYVPDDYGVTRTGGNVKDVVGDVLLGSKLKSNISDVERLVKLADQSPSLRKKQQAYCNIARVQQELSDVVEEMNQYAQSSRQQARERIEENELERQMSSNAMIVNSAKEWQQRLKGKGVEIEKALTGQPVGEELQVLGDACRFLGNRWRSGAKSKEGKQGQAEDKAPDLLALMTGRAVRGFEEGELARQTTSPFDATPVSLPANTESIEDARLRDLMDMPAAELKVPTSGQVYTYRRVEGHPELTVTLRSADSTWINLARAALVLMAILGWVVWRRKSRSARAGSARSA